MNFKYLYRSVITICCLLFASIAFAAPSAELESLLNSVHTMQANFTQTIFDNRGKAIQTSYGTMAYERPSKFRWQVAKPIPQVIIANATRLWIYDPDLEQVTIRSVKNAAGETPALLLSHGDEPIDTDFIVKPLPVLNGMTRFSLTPKHEESMFAGVQMGFTNHEIKEMRLEDHLGHLTLIQFNHIQTNVNLAASKFVFTPPANVDVIDETKQKQ